MNKATEPSGRSRSQSIGLLAGALVAVVMLLLPAPEGLSAAGWRTAALAACMGIWWATEALPVPVTSLLPIALFPIFGIGDIKTITAPYANSVIYLFLGGFLVALAVQRSGLHKRIALAIIVLFGGTGAGIVGGFMAASALISMWVTNTATAMMLLPIALSVVAIVQQNVHDSDDVKRNFPVAMLLGVAYGASIGGMATLVGTPPTALMAAFMQDQYQMDVGFGRWMIVGVPLMVCLLPICWWLLTRRMFPVRFTTSGATRGHLRRVRQDLGPMSSAERRVSVVFGLLVLSWLTRPLLTKVDALDGLSDPGIAMIAAITLFFIPGGGKRSSPLMRWKDAADVPWGILLLFGGGLTLASSVSRTGLAAWLGDKLAGFDLTTLGLLVLVVTTVVVFLTELTSNTATTAAFLPVVAAVAIEAGYPPIALAAPVAMAASCAFMLPVATPPNAVVYGSGMLKIQDMVRAGLWLNIISIVLVSLFSLFLVPRVLG